MLGTIQEHIITKGESGYWGLKSPDTVRVANKIDPPLGNIYNFMNTLVHERYHYQNKQFDNNTILPQDHLDAYLAQINHSTFGQTDLGYKG